MRAPRAGIVLAGFVAMAGLSSVVSAHPGSTTAVVVAAHAGRLDIALHTDARALVAKLEVAARVRGSDPSSPDDLVRRLTALAPTLAAMTFVGIDDAPATVAFRSITVDPLGQAVAQLAAPIPPGTQTFTWSTSLAYGAYPLSLRTPSGHEAVRWLQGHQRSEALPLVANVRETNIWQGVRLGFTHILPHGLDHILFVAGLVLLGTRLGPLAAQVSTFTVAHSVTLGLSLYGAVALPASLVEPLIALSVAYVGLENILRPRLTRWRLAVVFGFGLLHGLGFAEAVGALGLPRTELLTTLVSFNLGVELGQMAVVVLTWALLHGAFASWRLPVARLASTGITAMGVLWTLERVFT